MIHEKARLSVLTSLVAHPKGLVFGDLKQMCGLTDGNLSRHLAVLEEAGLIDIEKGYDHNRPQTVCGSRRRDAGAISTISRAGAGGARRGQRGESGRGAAELPRPEDRSELHFFAFLETLQCKVL